MEEDVDCEEELGKLINRKNDLAQRIKDKKMEILYQKTIESGKSVEEVISLIRENRE